MVYLVTMPFLPTNGIWKIKSYTDNQIKNYLNKNKFFILDKNKNIIEEFKRKLNLKNVDVVDGDNIKFEIYDKIIILDINTGKFYLLTKQN